MSRSDRMPTSFSPSLRTGRWRISCSFSRSIAFFIESPSSTNTGLRFMRLATIMGFSPSWFRSISRRSCEEAADQVERLRDVDLRHHDVQGAVSLPAYERFPLPLAGEERLRRERGRRPVSQKAVLAERQQQEGVPGVPEPDRGGGLLPDHLPSHALQREIGFIPRQRQRHARYVVNLLLDLGGIQGGGPDGTRTGRRDEQRHRFARQPVDAADTRVPGNPPPDHGYDEGQDRENNHQAGPEFHQPQQGGRFGQTAGWVAVH